MIVVSGLTKRFVLHTQGGVTITVFRDLSLTVDACECVALHGPSGSGKSTLLRSLYANYKPTDGKILVRDEGEYRDIAAAPPHLVLAIRRRTVGYVSQFLRVIPRIPTLNIVAEPLLANGADETAAYAKAKTLLTHLNIPETLWPLAPATFSGGEQQRVNIARGFAVDYPILLLDEPTASLDVTNQRRVVELIAAAKGRGAAVVGIFHDAAVREAVADRLFDMTEMKSEAEEAA